MRKDILSSLGHSRNSFCIKKTLKRATSRESITKLEMIPILQTLATHRKGIYALWRFIASGVWTKNSALNLEKIGPIGELVLGSLTNMEHANGARKYLENIDTSVCIPSLS